MRILNLGSVNIDHVYAVDHFVRPGETLDSRGYRIFAGGKGFNQTTALARAGASVLHAGKIGRDGGWLEERLRKDGADTSFLLASDLPTGHAIIQVAPSGENAILLHGGANRDIRPADLEPALAACSPGDLFLTQNETRSVPQALRLAKARGLTVAFNPAPMAPEVKDYPLDAVDLFILNETEAEGLTGTADPDEAGKTFLRRYPAAAVVLTLGKEGALYFDRKTRLHEPALRVKAVDTTAAGDTFIGFFLAEWMQRRDPAAALKQGCRAAALCVTRPGAADSIPYQGEVEVFQSMKASPS